MRLFHELVNEADDMLSNKMSKQFGYWLDQTGIEADGDVFIASATRSKTHAATRVSQKRFLSLSWGTSRRECPRAMVMGSISKLWLRKWLGSATLVWTSHTLHVTPAG